MLRIILIALLMLFCGCNDFSTTDSVLEPEKKEQNEKNDPKEIMPFSNLDSVEIGMQWKYLPWFKPMIKHINDDEQFIFSEDTLTLTLEKIEGNKLFFKEVSIEREDCELPGEIGILFIHVDKEFTITVETDTVIFDGDSKLLWYLKETSPKLPEAPLKHVENVDFKEDLHGLAFNLDNGYGFVDYLTIDDRTFSDVLVNCDATQTYCDGPGYCAVYGKEGILAVAQFIYSMTAPEGKWTCDMENRMISSGYLLVQ